MLSYGEFVGIEANSPDMKNKQKLVHAELQNHHQAIKMEEEGPKLLSDVQQVTIEDVRENYAKIKKEVDVLLKVELI